MVFLDYAMRVPKLVRRSYAPPMHPTPCREVRASAPPLSPSLQALLKDSHWMRNTVGEAGAEVYRIRQADGRECYLKYSSGDEDVATALFEEAARMGWLRRHAAPLRPVLPALQHFEQTSATQAWLLSTAMPGRTAYQWLEDELSAEQQRTLVQSIAQQLRVLHQLPALACPFNAGADLRLALAGQRLAAGLVDAEDFDEAREGWTPEDVWQRLQALRPTLLSPEGCEHADEGLVLTHGDYSLDNLLLDEQGHITGLIDLGRLGLADRYQDLAILWNCLAEFGPGLQELMWASYGIASPDSARLEFHLCLDEMF
ncbi:APH(3') family aminoglycoside O-phosphotransferase [Paucibacter sp. APW11]|uniref:Aminoglycoside 3'-phosphotransferase n=1 Tax=Roseateles aquae TaxID=3077235 RepID=A0ABU3PFR8_9BURK|nr:APH(3') family aminoglycoside O-phosphotransferase [Paucibacter sp. APW11]MDT9001442.1 APH(3') family aminoglycoside O-phosphotransferase [Paucibacter sp. APW11]